MRILHVIITLDPASGGPARVATRLAAAQARLGNDVTILSHLWNPVGPPTLLDAVKEMTASFPGFDRVKVEYLPWSGWKDALYGHSAKTWLHQSMANFDVVHIYNVWESMMRVAASEAHRASVPYFFQPNGLLDIWCMQQKRLKKAVAMRLFYRRMLDRAAGLILGNEDERIAIQHLRLTAPATILPLNTMFMEEVANLPPQGTFRKRYPQLENKPFIVFLGRLHHKKGLDYLADAFGRFAKRNPDVTLVVIGNDEGAQADFEQRIADHGVQTRVLLTGPLHGSAKWEAFRDAACFALPSRQEGFSIAIIEALATGLPVVISKECHFPEVGHAGAGEVVDLSAGAVAEAFERVFANPIQRQSMSSAARRLVETKFNCMVAAKDLMHVYEHAIRHNEALTGSSSETAKSVG